MGEYQLGYVDHHFQFHMLTDEMHNATQFERDGWVLQVLPITAAID